MEVALDQGMGNAVTRGLTAGRYVLRPSQDRQYVETFIAQLPAHARWYNGQLETITTAEMYRHDTEQTRMLSSMLSSFRALLMQANMLVREAADKAAADGHTITYSGTNIGLSGPPAINDGSMWAANTVAANAIAQYLNWQTFYSLTSDTLGTRNGIEIYVNNNRAGLIPPAGSQPVNIAPGGSSADAAKSFGMIAAGLGVAAMFLMRKGRRR